MVAESVGLVPDPNQAMQVLWLVPLLPLVGAVINLFFGKRLGKAAGWLAVVMMALSFAVAVLAVKGLLDAPEGERLFLKHLSDWISVGSLRVNFDLRLDALSATMILVVTGIGTLIHVYAIGYMDGDGRFGRFFAYLNLFVFFMLMLVLGANLLVLYLGWEGVGLCSYLLIGFWFDKTANANAAKKAFVTTRVGDTLMLVGLAVVVMKFGTLDYEVIFGAAGSTLTKSAATVISLLLFAGAVGKSAQLPLHVWLPDAMAGPTPVSALIHAATMVTAGVYLVVRMHPVFDLSPVALTVVTVTGLVTAIYAGTCALGQDDIKRVLAYSTISQLGFMFLAAGLKAYSAAIFFLVAHAFYKALMFLGAGSVMHGMHEETDLKVMGGLWRRMPYTAITFTLGALALSGVPPLAGFFAKDAVLEIAQSNSEWGYYLLGTLAAFISALYMGRLIFLAFYGTARSEAAEHAHESPAGDVDPARPARRGGRDRRGARHPSRRLARHLPGTDLGAGARGERGPVDPGLLRRGAAGDLRRAGHRVVRLRVGPGGLALVAGPPGAPASAVRQWVVHRRVLRRAHRHARQGDRGLHRLPHRRRVHRRHRERDRQRVPAPGGGGPQHPDGLRPHVRGGRVRRGGRDRRLRGVPPVNRLLTIVTFLPLVGLVVIMVGGKELKDDAARWITLVVALATFVVSLVVLGRFDQGDPGFQMVEHATWVKDVGLQYLVGIDGISIWMVLLTTFLFPVAVLASWKIDKDVRLYMGAMLALETAVLGSFVSLDLLLFFLFFEAILVPMYLLIGGWGGERRVYAAVKFFLYTMAGSAFLLVSIIFLYSRSGAVLGGANTFDLRQLGEVGAAIPLATARWLFLGFFIAFAVKVPVFPLHTWLPDAHTEAPTAGSVLLAGVLLKVGTYGLIRFNLALFPDASKYFATFVSILAVIGIVYGAVCALIQTDIKRLVAYSSVSHLGFVVLGIFAFTEQAVTGGVLQMVNHGLATGALFLLVGMVYERTHTRDLAKMGGLASVMPWLTGAFLFAVFASVGLPGLNSFVGEFLVIVGTFAVNHWFGSIAAIAVVLAAIYLLWSYQRMAFGPVRDEHRHLPDVSLREVAVLAPVLALLLVFGVYPKILTDRIDPSTEAVIAHVDPQGQTTDVGDVQLRVVPSELSPPEEEG